MNEKAKEAIEELEQIVLDLHRSAGYLDVLIASIENETFGKDELDSCVAMVIAYHRNCRKDYKRIRHYDSLEAKENEIWEKLMLALSETKDEES